MTQDEKIKKAAWNMIQGALKSGVWQTDGSEYGARVADVANVTAAALSVHGCFGDEYGDEGSFEVSLSAGYVANVAGAAWCVNPDGVWSYIADAVRDLDSSGCLTKAERARVRLFKEDEERKAQAQAELEAARRAEEEAARRAEEEAEKRRREQLAKRKEIDKKIKELKNQQKGGK